MSPPSVTSNGAPVGSILTRLSPAAESTLTATPLAPTSSNVGSLLESPCVIAPERPCSLLTIGSVTSPRTWIVSLPSPPITVVTTFGFVPRM